MPRSKPPAPSTVEGTLRVLSRIEAEDIPQELTRLRGYWPLLLDRIVERAVQLPREHFLEVIDWLLEEGIPAVAAAEDPPADPASPQGDPAPPSAPSPAPTVLDSPSESS